MFKGVTRSRQLRKGDNLTKSAKSVKYHPKRPLLMQKLKNCYLLVPRLLVVSTSGATSIPKEAKLTNAHSSSTCINCLGVVASFATKIKESSSTLFKISQTKMKKQPIVSWASTKMAEEFLAHIQLSNTGRRAKSSMQSYQSLSPAY